MHRVAQARSQAAAGADLSPPNRFRGRCRVRPSAGRKRLDGAVRGLTLQKEEGEDVRGGIARLPAAHNESQAANGKANGYKHTQEQPRLICSQQTYQCCVARKGTAWWSHTHKHKSPLEPVSSCTWPSGDLQPDALFEFEIFQPKYTPI